MNGRRGGCKIVRCFCVTKEVVKEDVALLQSQMLILIRSGWRCGARPFRDEVRVPLDKDCHCSRSPLCNTAVSMSGTIFGGPSYKKDPPPTVVHAWVGQLALSYSTALVCDAVSGVEPLLEPP